MATDDFLISINESDNTKMCRQSSNKFGQQSSKKIGLQIYSPSPHIKIEVIEGELVNSIPKPRAKILKEDPNKLCDSLDSNNWSFYKVPYPLRQVNEKAYEPNVISIGPYHHGKKHLETMEVIKRNCFIRMIKKSEPGKLVTAMHKLEKQVRNCYEKPFDRFDSDTFVEMMVLDGCFIVLLFQKNPYLLESLHKLRNGILKEIYCDLLLFENQLPFFVLSKLYGVIMSKVKIDEFPRWDLSCLAAMIPDQGICLPKKFPKPKYINHLLGLVHSSWLPSAMKRHDEEADSSWLPSAIKRHDAEAEEETETKTETEAEAEAEAKPEPEPEAKETKGQSLWKFICCGTEREEKGKGRKIERSRNFIRCATELEEAGINFVNKDNINKNNELVPSNIKSCICYWSQNKDRKDKIREEKKGKTSLFDIEFTDDGKLKIPTLSVDDNTERILRNFMAYEQFRDSSIPKYVCDYVKLMDNLINSGKDVQLLCNSGIIDNWLGNDEVVAQMFNKLHDFIYVNIAKFYYAEIFDKVDLHCKRRRNKWKAKLNKDYFNSPWAIISVLAAFVLLLLTLLQTIFSVLSYVHPK